MSNPEIDDLRFTLHDKAEEVMDKIIDAVESGDVATIRTLTKELEDIERKIDALRRTRKSPHDPIDMEYKLGYEDYRKGVPLDTNRSIYYQQGWLDEERWMLE